MKYRVPFRILMLATLYFGVSNLLNLSFPVLVYSDESD
mgnify:CR=1 FL=1